MFLFSNIGIQSHGIAVKICHVASKFSIVSVVTFLFISMLFWIFR